jgi:hypothetical protein
MTAKPKLAPRERVIAKLNQRHANLLQRVISKVDPNGDPGTRACLDALFGRDSSMNILAASNATERGNFARRLGGKACELATQLGFEMSMLEIVDSSWMFDRWASVFDVPLLRRVNNQLRKLAPCSLSVIQIGCLPSPSGQFQYCPIVRSAVFLKNPGASFVNAVAKLRRKLECPLPLPGGSVQIDTPPAQSARTWFTSVAQLFELRDPLASRIGGSDPAWKAGRADRTCERIQVMSMATLDKMVMATGDLAPVLDGLLREAGSRSRKLYADGDKQLHRDQIAHFWFEQQLRQKRYSAPPFVNLW